MLSEYNSNDSFARIIKENPEVENLIKSIIAEQKKTTSTFVHELRNPLSLLKGTIQYIEMKHPETKEYKYWDQMQDLINDMEHIMADVSTLNTYNYINREPTNLLTLMDSIIGSFMPQAITKQIELSCQVTPDSKEFFESYHCDPIKLKQVISNLIKNAFEATEPGNFIRVDLSHLPEIEPIPSKLSIKVSNNGQPIPEDEAENIFTPFVTYKKGGTGIGLVVVKKVIDLHYGSISVDSDEKLTSFTILLPL